jgi:transcriptional regulator with XRE-family HTH domain
MLWGCGVLKLGDTLRNLLDEHNLSQKELAARLSMAPSTLGNYIRNEREADYETLKRFAKFFDVSIDYLLGNQLNPAVSPKETELLRIFRSLTPDQQDLYVEQGRVFIIQNKKGEISSTSTLRKKMGR